MEHYASWQGLNKQLMGYLCPALQPRIRYFLTRYHDAHNAYGRAAVLLDGKELVSFNWVMGYLQERDMEKVYEQDGSWDWQSPSLRQKWDQEGKLSENDFLDAATAYRSMPIQEALISGNAIIRMLAIMDRRTGKRRLTGMMQGSYENEPEWLKQFYRLRMG